MSYDMNTFIMIISVIGIVFLFFCFIFEFIILISAAKRNRKRIADEARETTEKRALGVAKPLPEGTTKNAGVNPPPTVPRPNIEVPGTSPGNYFTPGMTIRKLLEITNLELVFPNQIPGAADLMVRPWRRKTLEDYNMRVEIDPKQPSGMFEPDPAQPAESKSRMDHPFNKVLQEQFDSSKFHDPPGQTTSPGQPAGPLRVEGQPLAEAEIATRHNIDHGFQTIDIDEYQKWLMAQPFPKPLKMSNIAYLTMGLGGEAGEAIELIKKHLRDGTPIDIKHLVLELGDVVLVVALIAAHFEISMSEMVLATKMKIKGRIARGTLRGSGDDR
jgi:NTP pyrophosphatase (non-canonical NTP hydrolase)